MLKELFRLNLPIDPNTICFSDDSAFLVIGSETPESKTHNDGFVSIDIWDLNSQSLTLSHCNKQAHKNEIQSVNVLQVSKNNEYILSGHNVSGGVQRWNLSSPQTPISAFISNSGLFIHDVKLADDKVFVVDNLNNQYILDAHTLKIIEQSSDDPFPLPDDINTHESEPHNNRAKISPDGKFIILEISENNHRDYFLEYRKFLSKNEIWRIGPYTSKELIKAIFFSPDGEHIICGGRKNSIDIYDSQTGTQINQVNTEAEISLMALSNDGNLLVEVFNTESGFNRLNHPEDLILRDMNTLEIIGRTKIAPGCFSDIKISPDNTKICLTRARMEDDIYYNQVICFDITR